MVLVTLNAGKMQKEKKTLDNSLIKKKIEFSSYVRKFRNGAVAKSYMTNGLIKYMGKYLLISSYFTKPFLFATAPL
jgi:hypothetical protein